MSVAELKRLLFQAYNDVNKGIYGYGVTELKISLIDSMILFMTRDNRVYTLEVLEENYALLKQNVDQALYTEFKNRLRNSLLRKLNLEAVSLHRDYDSNSRIAVTVVILNEAEFHKIMNG